MSQNVGTIDLELLLKSEKFKSELNGLQGQANQASTKISGALKGIGKAALAAFSVAAVTKFGKACLDVATQTSNAWIGLNSILTGQGKSFSQAQKFIQEYVSDGLVPLNNAVTAYKNLAARGYSSDQIKKTMMALKNAATFGRQSTYSLGEAVQTASEGLKNENSILVDNAGVTKNVAKMWEDYAKSVGKSTNQLTQAEKINAEVNGILEETKFQMNDATIYANTYSGKVAQLNFAFTSMKTAIGNVIQPLAKLFIPILTAAANAVTKLFTAIAGLMSMFGLKADSVETVSKGLGGVADNAEKASDAVKSVGDSAGKTAKQAKKATLQLAGFDEMNKLSDNSSSSSGGSSGGDGGASSALAESLDVYTNIQQDTSAFDGMLNKVKELANIFKEGFNASFGNINFDGILTHLSNIKNALIDIFTDSNVVNSANNLIKTWSYSFGQSVGAIARIGVNIAENLVGSIDGYLQKNSERIKKFLISMFDVTADRFTFVGNFMEAIGKISDVFSGKEAKSIGTSIIEMIVNPIMSLYDVLNKFVTDLTKILVRPIIDNCDLIKQTIENTLGPISSIFGTLAEMMTALGDKINEIYTVYISPFFENLSIGMSDTFGKLLEVWNTYIVPFLENISVGFEQLWTEHLSPLMDKVGGLIGSIVQAIQTLWNTVLKPLIDWIIQNVLPKLVPIFESLWNTIKTVFGYIADAIGKAIDFFKGLIGLIIQSIQTLWNTVLKPFIDWIIQNVLPKLVPIFESLWDAIKTVFGYIADEIGGAIDFFKGLIGLIIQAIQTLWNAVLKPFIDWIIQNVLPKLVPIFESLWDTIKTVFGYIADAIGGVIDFFKGLIDFIVGVFTRDWNKAWEGIKTTFNGIWNAIKGIVQAVWSAIKGIVETVINVIKTIISTVFNAIKTIITNIWNGIKTFFTNIWNAIKNVVSTVINSIKDTISNVFNGIKNTITNIWNNIVTTISNVWNTIKTKVKEGAQGAWNAITSIFGNIANWFKNIFTQAWTAVKNVFSTGGKIFDGIKEGIVNFFKTIVNGIIGAINKIIAVPFNAINGILQKIHDVEVAGFKPFTWVHKFNVPQIPMLAQGGFVEANTPRLAVVGDNKTQGEIISPVDKMKETFLSALQEFRNMNSGMGGDYVPIEINIPISLDGEEIQRKQDERKARLALATNGRRY